VLALDRDPTAIAGGAGLVAASEGRLTLAEAPFSTLDEVARRSGLVAVDGVVLDIGVSSMQLDEPLRGFSFQGDGPLDMRMSGSGPSARDFLADADEEEIADVIYAYGEEHRSRAIARAIVRRRATAPIATTRALADLVLGVFHGRKADGRHPATRTFQALRIHVNDELGELERGLAAAERILRPGGRLVVVTFHSLEDRIVKRFLTERCGKTAGTSRHLPPQSIKSEAPSFRFVNPRPLTPSQGELDANPRARSARLRAAVRTEAPPHTLDRRGPGVRAPPA
jgi:16S rRNA (cytosine1402-N4)-methyltransferase